MAAPHPPGGNGALSLRGWAAEAEAAANIAKALAPTSFIPDHLRVWTNPRERDPDKRELDYESTVAQVAAVLLAGQELELGPMGSLRAFVVIKGTVALYAVAARALLLHKGHEVIVKESTSARAIVVGRRAGSDIWQTSTWDLDRAKTAGLYPGHPDGNWRKQTKAMLVARATAEVSRWVAADAMLGLPLFVEEVEDADHEIPAIDAAAAVPPPAPSPEQQPKTGTAKRKTAPRRAALPAGPPPPPPPEPPPGQAPPPGPKPSRAQLAKLHAGLTDLQITGREEGLGLVSAWAGRTVASTTHLTRDELDVILDRIDALRAVAAHHPPPEQGQDGPPPEEPDAPPPDQDLEASPP